MAAPRAKAIRPPSRSRFFEGSMNDRASAVPPVQFLGAEERATLEQPAGAMSFDAELGPQAYQQQAQFPPFYSQNQHHQQQPDTGAPKLNTKRSSRILGQVWDGVWGRLGFRRDNNNGNNGPEQLGGTRRTTPPALDEAAAIFGAAKDDRPSRDEVLASYHQLVASGFFSAHAIQSTRRPGPGSATGPGPGPGPGQGIEGNYPPPPFRAAPSVPSSRPSSSAPNQASPFPSTWPLSPPASQGLAAPSPFSTAPPLTPPRMVHPHPSSPMCAPNSAASSRGTKRAADSDNDDEEVRKLTPRKLRKSASREGTVLPRLRNVGSSRNILSRTFSTTGTGTATDPSSMPGVAAPPLRPQREPARLTKRVLAKLPGQRTLDMPIRRSSRRNVSDCQQEAQVHVAEAVTLTNVSTRLLRSRKSATEPMRVVPDANRGIPHVPAIPQKFTYGEDRENGVPWRGLRR